MAKSDPFEREFMLTPTWLLGGIGIDLPAPPHLNPHLDFCKIDIY